MTINCFLLSLTVYPFVGLPLLMVARQHHFKGMLCGFTSDVSDHNRDRFLVVEEPHLNFSALHFNHSIPKCIKKLICLISQ